MNLLKQSRILLILSTIVVSSIHVANAQSNLLFYHTDDFYNASDYNPAALTQQKEFTLNLFPLSGFGVSYNNYDAVKKVRQILFSDLVDDKSKEVFRSLVKKDLSYNYLNLNLLNLGINTTRGAFNFQIKEKVYVLMRYGNEFTRFLMDTTGFESVKLNNFQDFPTQGVHFREYSLGYANEIIRNKLTVGIRAKRYYGKSFINSAVSGQMTEQDGKFYAQSNGDLYFSIPATNNGNGTSATKIRIMDGMSVGDYVFNTGNSGLGIDIGLNWKINKQMSLSVSALDLGSISWKKHLYRLNFDNGLYEVGQVHINPETGKLEKEAYEVNLVNDIARLYDIDTSPDKFNTKLPATFFAGINYKVSTQVSIGLVDRYIHEENMAHNSFSALINYTPSPKFTIISGLGVYGKSFKNMPIGFLYKWKAAQLYAGTDNLLSAFVPQFSDYSSLTFGVDLNLFGPKVQYKKVKYLPFFRLKQIKRKRRNGLIFQNPS